jgi:hypothetical protein
MPCKLRLQYRGAMYHIAIAGSHLYSLKRLSSPTRHFKKRRSIQDQELSIRNPPLPALHILQAALRRFYALHFEQAVASSFSGCQIHSCFHFFLDSAVARAAILSARPWRI